MALPNKPLGETKAVKDPAVDEREVDVLIVGGGMAACGAAFEVKKWLGADQTVLLLDKAAMERSGAVAQGLKEVLSPIGVPPDRKIRKANSD
jgi:adenylylsulfate reductase subunit A